MPWTVYHYPACSTCKRALRWLADRGIEHERVHIVEQPPTRAELERALDQGLPLRALFNTSGQSYRDGNFKERLPTLSREQALTALCQDGKLIKRPFVTSAGTTLVGFSEGAFEQAFKPS